MSQIRAGEWAAVVIAVAAVFGASMTGTSYMLGDVRDNLSILREDVREVRANMENLREDFSEFKLESSVEHKEIQLLLQQLIHGPDLESPERIAQTQ